jgi:nucleotide-binding universal stress UspA family protein
MFKKIMLALDCTEPHNGALQYATRLANESGGEVTVIHVKQLMAGRGAGPVHLDEPTRLANVRREVGELKRAGIAAELELHSAIQSPAGVIAGAARRVDADVIITGVVDHGKFAAMVAGNVPRKLVRTAPCPVLTIRDPRPIAA